MSPAELRFGRVLLPLMLPIRLLSALDLDL